MAGRLWPWLGVTVVAALAAGLRLWRLDQNGYGTAYYTAGVRSMLESWHNFFYNSFDPTGFVSVDKPPVALWIQAASAKLFGFSGLSVLVPQVLEGIASVLLLFHLVRRRFGVSAGLFAALALALTPISVAVDRSSNTDSCLVLVLLLSAWALSRAAETGSWRLLLLSMALVGLGFNVKMLAAFVVLPTFYLVYFLGAPVVWRSRLGDLTLAGVVLLVVSLSWSVAYDLTPPDKRPFAGSSKENSMLELTIGHNGLERFARRGGRFPQPGDGPPGGGPPVFAFPGAGPADGNNPPNGVFNPVNGQPLPPWVQPGAGPQFPGAQGRTPGGPPGFGGRAPIGPLRLANPHMAAQTAWLFPLAVMGLLVGAFQSKLTWTLSPAHLALLLWFGWALTYGIVYSWAGGIFHEYYLVTMAPPLGALAGVGVTGLWSCYRRGGWRIFLLPVALLLTAAWQAYLQNDYLGWNLTPEQARSPSALVDAIKEHLDWRTWLYLALLGGTAIAVLGLLVLRPGAVWRRVGNYLAPVALGVGLLALLALPTAWALSNVLVRGNTMLPFADLDMLARGLDGSAPQPFPGRFGNPPNNQKLTDFLRANHQGERYLLATTSAMQAAPIIIETGQPVMALGGFMGSDRILAPEQFAELVEQRQIRFVMLGGFGGFRRRADSNANEKTVMDWVRENGKPVDPALWRAPLPETGGGNAAGPRRPQPDGPNTPGGRFPGGFMGRMGAGQLYDLRPGDGVVAAPAEHPPGD